MKFTLGENMEEEREITTARPKGQIVILQKLRKELQIKPNTKLAVYRRDDKLVVARLAIPPLGEELKNPLGETDAQNKKRPTAKERKSRLKTNSKRNSGLQG